MFDSIDLNQAISDIYDVGLNDDTLVLLHEANKDIQMSVKTNNGLTELERYSFTRGHMGVLACFCASRLNWEGV